MTPSNETIESVDFETNEQGHPYHAHQARFQILEHRTAAIEKHIDTLLERTAPIAYIATTLDTVHEKLDELCIDFNKHKTDQKSDEEETGNKLIEVVTTSAGLKTKTDILWYVVIVIVLGTLLAKILIPSLGL